MFKSSPLELISKHRSKGQWLGILFLFLTLVYTGQVYADVFVNQAGFLPLSHKVFFSSTQSDSFFVFDVSTLTRHFAGPMKLSKIADPSTGLTLYSGDFSDLTTPGHYRIILKTADTSSQFPISDSVYHTLYRLSLKSYYYQRCGSALPSFFAGIYARSGCHGKDGTFHSTADATGFHSGTGGWHDAGDFGKYIVNAGISVGTLLLAFEQFPERFSDDRIGILESNNGIPDILDEVRYELNWMRKMQSPSGGVYHKLTREQFSGFTMPSDDNSAIRYIYPISSAATGNFAAVFAKAARLYKKYDSAFSAVCLQAATTAWQYLQNNSAIVPPGGFKNPSGTATGEYGDSNDADERLWAAAEIWNTTGDEQFYNYYMLHYAAGPVFDKGMNWQNVSSLAHFALLFSAQSTLNENVVSSLKNALQEYANTLVSTANSDGMKISLKNGEYNWGSNGEVLNRAVVLILSYMMFGNQEYYLAAQSHMEYVAGRNAHALSFITGIGERHVMHPHHRVSESDGIVEPVPGLVAGGPDQFRSDPYLRSLFTNTTPPALIYGDDVQSYASNEVAINWNAPLVFVAGYFSNATVSTIKGTGHRIIPASSDLIANYPNPFNPVTRISVALADPDTKVNITVFDILGRKIQDIKVNESIQGDADIVFDAGGLNSGIYVCRLQTKNTVSSTKMVLLK